MEAVKGLLEDISNGAAQTNVTQRVAQRGRALIADDEAAVRLVLHEMLSRLGYEPVCAEDGRVAIALLDAPDSRFELMICDLTMPNINGLEVLEHASEMSPDLPAIITTGNDDWNKFNEYAHINLLGVLPKPFGMPELRGLLEERLGTQFVRG